MTLEKVQLKVRKFWGLILITFEEIKETKLVGGPVQKPCQNAYWPDFDTNLEGVWHTGPKSSSWIDNMTWFQNTSSEMV